MNLGDVVLAIGLVLLAVGVWGFARERRRLRNVVAILLGLAVLPIGVLLSVDENSTAAQIALLLVVVVFGILTLGYPVLTVFLLWNGVTMIRRESRSLGNLLSLLAGIALLLLPWTLPLLGIAGSGLGLWNKIGVAVVLVVLGCVAYVGFCFLVFLLGAVLYRRVPASHQPKYVIVLGSGLIGARVPPLLAARLDRGIQVAARTEPAPAIIPSGGQGPDEEVAEGVAMAGYLMAHGVPESQVIIEDRARTTEQNLRFSREMMDHPDAPVTVVTNNYHVFRTALLTRSLGLNARVSGARTAAYFVPSAFLREFIAVMRDNLRFNAAMLAAWAVAAGLLVYLSMST